MEILIHITWFLALCSTFASFFFDKKKIILSIQALTLILFSSHLFLVWGFSWAWFLAIQILRNLFFAFVSNTKMLTLGFVGLIWIYTYIYFLSIWIDDLAIFPYIATILGTLWCYVSHTTLVRLFFFSSTFPFTYYVFQTWSYFAIIIQLTFMTSIFINIIRFDILKYKKVIPIK